MGKKAGREKKRNGNLFQKRKRKKRTRKKGKKQKRY